MPANAFFPLEGSSLSRFLVFLENVANWWGTSKTNSHSIAPPAPAAPAAGKFTVYLDLQSTHVNVLPYLGLSRALKHWGRFLLNVLWNREEWKEWRSNADFCF
jgi:hypothetical protein